MMTEVDYPKKEPCGGCGAGVGQRHLAGCDWERCPRCGGQIIACECIYKECFGPDVDLEKDHPEIYAYGPTKEMYQQWGEAIGDDGWVLHDGYFPGTQLAVEQEWYVHWGPITSERPWGGPWIECSKDHPDAEPDLNKAARRGVWDPEKKRLVLRGTGNES